MLYYDLEENYKQAVDNGFVCTLEDAPRQVWDMWWLFLMSQPLAETPEADAAIRMEKGIPGVCDGRYIAGSTFQAELPQWAKSMRATQEGAGDWWANTVEAVASWDEDALKAWVAYRFWQLAGEGRAMVVQCFGPSEQREMGKTFIYENFTGEGLQKFFEHFKLTLTELKLERGWFDAGKEIAAEWEKRLYKHARSEEVRAQRAAAVAEREQRAAAWAAKMQNYQLEKAAWNAEVAEARARVRAVRARIATVKPKKAKQLQAQDLVGHPREMEARELLQKIVDTKAELATMEFQLAAMVGVESNKSEAAALQQELTNALNEYEVAKLRKPVWTADVV